ncbi:MAG: aldehyde dehydrogenase family protein [Planctomycetota bacterium]|jgi:aldehyde dehydrogenase (NAD+)|nr:aldehyde dehydrogenase family protein [Planctomycetota bacterium]MDP6763792.1 aldehyde dehydrogenase family protein [Planctomycetota bacterium]MDP6989004.1 aldehyde dehydrogenase family protein [Planctomycetota bacterium]
MNPGVPTLKSLDLPALIAGREVRTNERLEVHYPFTGEVAGTVSLAGPDELEEALAAAWRGGDPLSRHERHAILERARALLGERADEFAELILAETGLCAFETRYEVGRSQDVLQFAAIAALEDDGGAFACDISPNGQARRIFTLREPLRSVAAITPFNHPLNQVTHKIAPAVAAGAPAILKPSEKTPLVAVRFAELLYEAGLPGWMLSCLVGPIEEVVEPLIADERIELVSFTGSAAIGKRIARTAGYKKLCLELGGNSPLIVLADADLDLAVTLAAEGCYRNSGQRCTAVKRLLVAEGILEEFTERLVARTAEYVCGDPADPNTRVGTVIDEAAAIRLAAVTDKAVAEGARVLCGGRREGALLQPTVIADVPRTAEMVVEESFGPLAPIMAVRDVDDAIELANATAYGLSSGIVTNDLDAALKAVRSIRTGTVNVNQVPGFRIERSPFGGVKDSGLGIKEGVIESMKTMSNVKTFSLPW